MGFITRWGTLGHSEQSIGFGTHFSRLLVKPGTPEQRNTGTRNTGTPEQHHSGTRNTGTLKILNFLKIRKKLPGGV
jgi:hypothetical protein